MTKAELRICWLRTLLWMSVRHLLPASNVAEAANDVGDWKPAA